MKRIGTLNILFSCLKLFQLENADILDIMNHLPVVPMLRLGVIYTKVMEQLLGVHPWVHELLNGDIMNL